MFGGEDGYTCSVGRHWRAVGDVSGVLRTLLKLHRVHALSLPAPARAQ